MDELVAFLRARFDEDEAVVRAIYEPHDWHVGPGDDPGWEDESTVYMWPPEFHTPYEEDKHWRGLTTSGPDIAAHIARHDPARVLREVVAKRALLDDYERFVAEHRRMMGGWDSYPEPSPVLTAFAAVYADHPDYRSEWAPTT